MAEPSVAGIVTTYRDITERKAEKALRESQQMLQLVIDNIPQFIFRRIWFTWVATQLAQLAGVDSPENIVGKTDYDVPEERRGKLFRESDRRVMETGTPEYHIVEPCSGLMVNRSG